MVVSAVAVRTNPATQPTTQPTTQPATTPAAPPKAKKHDITVGQLAKGLVAALPGGAIDGVGVTASALVHTPHAVCNVYRSLYHDKETGPVLKTLYGVLTPVAFAVGLPIVSLAAVGYGIGKGAYDASQEGIAKSVKNRFDDVHQFNTQVHDGLKEWDKDIEREKNAPPKATGSKP